MRHFQKESEVLEECSWRRHVREDVIEVVELSQKEGTMGKTSSCDSQEKRSQVGVRRRRYWSEKESVAELHLHLRAAAAHQLEATGATGSTGGRQRHL